MGDFRVRRNKHSPRLGIRMTHRFDTFLITLCERVASVASQRDPCAVGLVRGLLLQYDDGHIRSLADGGFSSWFAFGGLGHAVLLAPKAGAVLRFHVDP